MVTRHIYSSDSDCRPKTKSYIYYVGRKFLRDVVTQSVNAD